MFFWKKKVKLKKRFRGSRVRWSDLARGPYVRHACPTTSKCQKKNLRSKFLEQIYFRLKKGRKPKLFSSRNIVPVSLEVKYCLASGFVLFCCLTRNWQSAKHPENLKKKTISSALNVNPYAPANQFCFRNFRSTGRTNFNNIQF